MAQLTSQDRDTLNRMFPSLARLAGFLEWALPTPVGDFLNDLYASANGAVTSLTAIAGNISFLKEVNHTVTVDASTTTNANGANLTFRAGPKNGTGSDGILKVGDASTSEVDIGSSAGKIGLYGVTAVTQPQTNSVTNTGFVAGASTPVLVDSTFTGGIGTTAYHLSDVVAALKQLGALKA